MIDDITIMKTVVDTTTMSDTESDGEGRESVTGGNDVIHDKYDSFDSIYSSSMHDPTTITPTIVTVLSKHDSYYSISSNNSIHTSINDDMCKVIYTNNTNNNQSDTSTVSSYESTREPIHSKSTPITSVMTAAQTTLDDTSSNMFIQSTAEISSTTNSIKDSTIPQAITLTTASSRNTSSSSTTAPISTQLSHDELHEQLRKRLRSNDDIPSIPSLRQQRRRMVYNSNNSTATTVDTIDQQLQKSSSSSIYFRPNCTFINYMKHHHQRRNSLEQPNCKVAMTTTTVAATTISEPQKNQLSLPTAPSSSSSLLSNNHHPLPMFTTSLITLNDTTSDNHNIRKSIDNDFNDLYTTTSVNNIGLCPIKITTTTTCPLIVSSLNTIDTNNNFKILDSFCITDDIDDYHYKDDDLLEFISSSNLNLIDNDDYDNDDDYDLDVLSHYDNKKYNDLLWIDDYDIITTNDTFLLF